jgi:hypothetical protein
MVMDPGIDLTIDYDNTHASRGDDVDGDGIMEYNPSAHDLYYDFNSNGVCDTGVGEPYYAPAGFDTLTGSPIKYADLNKNGVWDSTELVRDNNGNGVFDLPPSGDFEFWRWEMLPWWVGERFDFSTNDFAVVIDATAETVDGVAYARITYPRQMARRLIASVNGEANGISDRDGERFVLPVVRGQ